MIYTKTGDKGTTSLASGERVKKSDLRIETYGTADELNAYFGWLGAMLDKMCGELPPDEPVKDVTVHCEQVLTIQNKLFNLGAFLSEAPGEWISEQDVTEVEHWIDLLQEELPPQHAFSLPAGSEEIAAAHICRTVTRRLERLMVRLLDELTAENAEPDRLEQLRISLRWVNRISDFCYVLSRKCNILLEKSPILWKK